MSSVDLKILSLTVVTILAYTVVANVIPQVESDVPEDIALGEDVTAEELVDAGRSLYEGAGGCLACHAETAGARGPNLLTDHAGEGMIGERCDERVPGLDCKEFLYQALVRPQDHIVEGYPPIMPPTDRTLSQTQIWALVAYLQSLGGEVTVTGADIASTEEGGGEAVGEAGEAGAAAAGPAVATTDAETILRELCVMCHPLGDEGTPMGPAFDDMGAHLSAEEIRTKILDPGAFVADGYEQLAGVMPPNFGEQLTAAQLESIVRYLSEQR